MNRHLSAAVAATAAAALIRTASAQTAPPAPAPAATEQPAPAPSAPVPAQSPADLAKVVEMQRADLDEQDARIGELERQLKAMKQAPPPANQAPGNQPPPKAAETAAGPAQSVADYPFKVHGYIQSQYEFHQDSQDQLFVGGAPMNQDRFLLRRVRLKLEHDWQYGGAMVEFDANTVNGPAIGLQHAEVSLAYRDAQRKPIVRAVLGLFDNPFGREVVESPRVRPFMERSYASREFFPSEPDLGVEIMGALDWFRFSVAAVNGQPLGDKTGFVLQDPNSHKDIVGRVGVAIDLPHDTLITGGASLLNGEGFRPGTDPTKNSVQWRDNLVENSLIEPSELIGIPGTAGTPSVNFSRWLVGVDLGVEFVSPLGSTHVFGEISAASNMDRNVFIADPVTAGYNVREFGYYAQLYQEFRLAAIAPIEPIAGFRYDFYDPDSDVLEKRSGQTLPLTESVTTYAPLIGIQIQDRARLVGEWDIIKDSMARNTLGVPVDRKNNIVTIRLQGEL
ncbi:MAG TPA: hypothetical protein VK745_08310 [Polyangiaceae bacterium]|nr:hypothetical protein [Polyangiaceae bacterium]